MINKRGLKSFIGINTINDNEPKYITRLQKRKANRLKRILEEKPELNFKPSIKLIPDMPKYQTPEERARFLMSRFKYTEIPLDYYDYDLPSGYI